MCAYELTVSNHSSPQGRQHGPFSGWQLLCRVIGCTLQQESRLQKIFLKKGRAPCSLSSSSKGWSRLICTTCSFSPFLSLRLSYRCIIQGPVHWRSSFPFVGCLGDPFDPVVRRWGGFALLWKCCHLLAEWLILASTNSLSSNSFLCRCWDPELLWPENWECELTVGCVQIRSHGEISQCWHVL